MLLPKRLIKKIGWLPVLALIYVVAGLPLIHPFFHHHSEKHCHIAGRQDLNRGFSNDEQPLKEFHRHSHCCICSFLHHFYLNHPALSPAYHCGEHLLMASLPINAFFIEQRELTALFPRPPPIV